MKQHAGLQALRFLALFIATSLLTGFLLAQLGRFM